MIFEQHENRPQITDQPVFMILDLISYALSRGSTDYLHLHLHFNRPLFLSRERSLSCYTHKDCPQNARKWHQSPTYYFFTNFTRAIPQ